jgi:phospholipid/cholesterol/gamma-HCH transport system ATP-binding protein
MTLPTVLDIRGLSSHYAQRQVLFDIHFTIPRRQISVIMGPSGCGKSTLIRHLIALNPNRPHQVFLENRDMAGFSGNEMATYRRRIGVLFQSGALFNSLTVSENVAVPLRVHTRLANETIRIITEIKLHQVGLSGFGSYMPSQLSGGMQKRAGLARSLAMDPEILFVDEPSSGLDPITAAGLDDLILELRDASGMTIVVVTHELESAFKIGDQVIVLDQGHLIAAGTPDEIRSSQDKRVIQFLERKADQSATNNQAYLDSLLGAS